MTNIESLYEQAKDLLEESRFSEARVLGHQLLKARFSGAFEILASSFHGEGALDVAITVLENAVREAPQVWLLWMQLGNYLSESGRLLEAVESYQKAKACPGAEIDQLDLNEAMMRLLYGNKDRALELFEKVVKRTSDNRIRLVALKHRLCTLIELERVTEAMMELGEAYLHDSDNSELLTTLSHKLLEVGDQVNALNLAKQALGLKRAGTAAEVVRKLEGAPLASGHIYWILMHGCLDDENGDPLFFHKTSTVYADSPEEAEKLALLFEPPDVRPDLEVQEVEAQEAVENERKGVNWSSGLVFYTSTAESDASPSHSP